MRVAKFCLLLIVALLLRAGPGATSSLLAQGQPPVNAQAAIDNQPVKLGPGARFENWRRGLSR